MSEGWYVNLKVGAEPIHHSEQRSLPLQKLEMRMPNEASNSRTFVNKMYWFSRGWTAAWRGTEGWRNSGRDSGGKIFFGSFFLSIEKKWTNSSKMEVIKRNEGRLLIYLTGLENLGRSDFMRRLFIFSNRWKNEPKKSCRINASHTRPPQLPMMRLSLLAWIIHFLGFALRFFRCS